MKPFEGEITHKHTHTERHARAHTHTHINTNIKEERQSLEVAWSCFPINATGENKRLSMSTVGTLSGLQTNTRTHTHTHLYK